MADPDRAVAAHEQREDEPWAIEIPDHPGRTESTEFRHAKEAMHKILAAVGQDTSASASLVRSIST